MIRTVKPTDAASIAEIYNYYIRETVVTFEDEPVSTEDMQQRINSLLENHIWLVYTQGNKIMGYAYAGPWRLRSAYRYAVETSVYLSTKAIGKGIGTTLYKTLIEQVRQKNFHVAIGGIALPNEASIALHEKCGFEKNAHFKQVGYKFGQWIDVGYWQLVF